MKLYYSKGACSLVVRIVLNELGISSQFESVDLKSKKTESGEDYKTINVKGAVPALLLDNGHLLTENAVILQYLADITTSEASQALLPPLGQYKRYQVLEWLNYITTEWHKGFALFFNAAVSQEIKDELFVPLIHPKFKFINAHLAKSKYLAGEHFTLPDAYLFVVLFWAVQLKMDLKEWPYIAAYYQEQKQRTGIQEALLAEGIKLP